MTIRTVHETFSSLSCVSASFLKLSVLTPDVVFIFRSKTTRFDAREVWTVESLEILSLDYSVSLLRISLFPHEKSTWIHRNSIDNLHPIGSFLY